MTPKYWYINMDEMENSEHCELFKEWFEGRIWSSCQFWSSTFYWFSWCENWGWFDWSFGVVPFDWVWTENMTLLTPQEWYDQIYDGEKEETKFVFFENPRGMWKNWIKKLLQEEYQRGRQSVFDEIDNFNK